MALKFAETYNSKEYQLFEVPEELLAEILAGRQKAVIKPHYIDESAKAALSTNDQTFKIKKAENTNKLFVVESAGKDEGQI